MYICMSSNRLSSYSVAGIYEKNIYIYIFHAFMKWSRLSPPPPSCSEFDAYFPCPPHPSAPDLNFDAGTLPSVERATYERTEWEALGRRYPPRAVDGHGFTCMLFAGDPTPRRIAQF